MPGQEKVFYIYSKNFSAQSQSVFYGCLRAETAQQAIEDAPDTLDLFPKNGLEIIAIAACEYQPQATIYAITAVDADGKFLRLINRVTALNDQEALAQAQNQCSEQLRPGEHLTAASMIKVGTQQRVEFIRPSVDETDVEI